MECNRFFSSAVVNFLVLLVLTVAPVFPQNQNKVIEWSKSPIGSKNETAAGHAECDSDRNCSL